MWVYIVNIALILFWWWFYTATKTVTITDEEKTNNIPIRKGIVANTILYLPFIQLYLIMALKNNTVGTDTKSYIDGFNLILNISWHDVFDFKIKYLVFNFERGFIIISKLISFFTDNFTSYNAVIDILLIIPLYKFIKKHSAMPFFSVILFTALGFLNFYLSGMRQAIAMSIVLFSYDYIVQRKFWKFSLLIVIASLFHESALFFFPAYFLSVLTITPLYYFVSFVIVFLLRAQIFSIVTHFIYSNKGIEDTGAYRLLGIVFLTFIAGMFSYKKIIKGNDKITYNLVGIAAALMIFNTVSNIGLRVANYYYLFMIIFIPNIIISTIKNKLLKYFAVFIFIAFTLTFYFSKEVNYLGGYPYTFFWQ